MTERIRWDHDGTEGYVGTIDARVFTIWPPEEETGGEWLLTALLPDHHGYRFYGTQDELKAEAERWLERFISSLGAIFGDEAAADLRSRAEELGALVDRRPGAERDKLQFAAGLKRAADLIEYGDVPAVNPEPAKETGQ